MNSRTENSSLQMRPAGKISFAEITANSIFESLLAVFVVWTVMTQAARIFNYSFAELREIFSYLLIPLLLLIGKIQSLKWRYAEIFIDKAEIHALTALSILMLVGAVLALGSIRPDTDDVDYTSQILYFFNHPERPLDLLRHDHGLIDMPFHWPIYIFYSLELLCAYIAWLFNIPFLHIFYFLLPVLGGLLLPLAWFLAFSKFSQRTMITVLAVTAVCVFLSLNGSPHRSFGNFAFVRIWQGKTMLMSILTPLFLSFTIDFFRASTLSNWLRLTALMTSASGITAMSAFYLPFMSVVGVSYWLIQEKKSFKQLAWYFSSYFYLILVAGYFKAVVNKDAIKFHGEDSWPTTFTGQFKLVFTDFVSWPSIALAGFITLSLFLAKKPERRFLTYWLTGIIALFLNPIVFPVVGNHVTSLNNYWRLFYLLPFPFAVGFPVIALQSRLPEKPMWGSLAFTGILLIGILGNVFPNRYSYYYATFGKADYAFGSYKIKPDLNSDVQTIIAKATPGIMLAPVAYSSLIPIYSTDFPQVSVRWYMIMSLQAGYGKSIEATQKIKAVNYISGEAEDGLADATSLLNKHKNLVNVVIDPKTTRFSNWPTMAENLAHNNFKQVVQNEHFLLYTKPN